MKENSYQVSDQISLDESQRGKVVITASARSFRGSESVIPHYLHFSRGLSISRPLHNPLLSWCYYVLILLEEEILLPFMFRI